MSKDKDPSKVHHGNYIHEGIHRTGVQYDVVESGGSEPRIVCSMRSDPGPARMYPDALIKIWPDDKEARFEKVSLKDARNIGEALIRMADETEINIRKES